MGLREAAAALRNGDSGERTLREELRRQTNQSEYLLENMRALEMQMTDEGWRRLASSLEHEFTRGGLDDLMSMSRAMYMVNPLIQRAVNVTGYYTWAQGVSFKAEEPKAQDIIDEMVEDYGNRAEIYGHQARILTDVDQMVDGNTFTALFTNENNGFVATRSIPAEQIRDIITHPEDRALVHFYRRDWQERTLNQSSGTIDVRPRTTWYPDWRHRPRSKTPQTIAGDEVNWNAPIIHQRTGGLKKMQFGVPETYAALDWARAYKKFLEDWHTIVSSLARFAWRLTTKAKRVDDAKRKLGSTVTPDEPSEQNEERQGAGGVFIHPSDEMTPIPKTGATTSAEDAKPSRLMVGAAMNLPDNILSTDIQQGALATAKTLDRPTELGMRSRQQMWADLHQDIFSYRLDQAAIRSEVPRAASLAVEVSFPPILEHDVKETVGAIVSAATLDGKAEAGTMPRDELSRSLMQAVGVEDVEAQMESLDGEQQQQLTQTVEMLREAAEAATHATRS